MALMRSLELGTEYQHRYFWIQACRLFNGSRNVRTVALEEPIIRAFDDVVTTYKTPIVDAFMRPIIADHFQLKFHLTQREVVRASDLIDPEFIGATAVSLLQRARDAFENGDAPRRLTLVTCWDVDPKDVLGELISSREGEFEVERLLSAKPGGVVGQVREKWREHLGGIDDGWLRRMLRALRIEVRHRMDELDELLERDLQLAGLAPVDRTVTIHPYVALSRRFIVDRMQEFNAGELDARLRMERLRVSDPVAARTDAHHLALKSFSRFATELEDANDTLNLLPYFHGRHTADAVDWDRDVVPRVTDFLTTRVKQGGRFVLHLDTHLSVTYLAGVVLGKSPAVFAPATWGRIWSADEAAAPVAWSCREEPVGDGDDLAIALEVSRAISDDVCAYLRARVPAVGRLVILTVPGGASSTSVKDGAHALGLARGVAAALRQLRTSAEREHPLHLFVAAPAPFAFFLGREGRAFGPTVTYEYDLEDAAPTAYTRALHIHPQKVGGTT